MAQPYVGEIKMFAGNFPPSGWMTCDGQLLAISEYETLFTLIGTTYGGDGQSTFALPNLAARVPIHAGTNGASSYGLAQNGGVGSVTLTTQQIPTHTHTMLGIGDLAGTSSPVNAFFAKSSSNTPYTSDTSTGLKPLKSTTLGLQGSSQPHDNYQPYLAITYIISLFGIFPSQT